MDHKPKKYHRSKPRVSEIVSFAFPFEGTVTEEHFIEWVESHDIHKEEYMRLASSAGTKIHNDIRKRILGKKTRNEFRDYVDSAIRFLYDMGDKIIETELFVEGEFYQGTIDLICEIDGEIWIIDWKTWGIAKDLLDIPYSYKKPYEKLKKTALQLSLYDGLYKVDRIGVVELVRGGYNFYPLKKVEYKDILEDYITNKGLK